MVQHREKAVHMSICEDMVQTSATSHDFKRGRAMIVRYSTISGIATRVGPSMAATSYNIARLCTIHPDGTR